MLYGLILGLVVLTFWVVLVGAPYVPTRHRDIEKLFNLVDMKDSERLVDLGSGDGRLQLAAAQRRIRSTGFELSLPLWLVSRWRLRPVTELAEVRLANFWKQSLPDDTGVVFTFLASKYMARLERHLQAETDRLQRPLRLVSYGFEIDGRRPIKRQKALLVYLFEPKQI